MKHFQDFFLMKQAKWKYHSQFARSTNYFKLIQKSCVRERQVQDFWTRVKRLALLCCEFYHCFYGKFIQIFRGISIHTSTLFFHQTGTAVFLLRVEYGCRTTLISFDFFERQWKWRNPYGNWILILHSKYLITVIIYRLFKI